MARNFVQAGGTLTLTAPANVKSGGIVVVGALAGVAAYDAAQGEEVEVTTEGVFTLPKTTPGGINQGDAAYWDSVASKVTATAGSNLLLGICVVTAGTSETTCHVKLTVPSGALAVALAALDARVTTLESA
jgi:predicted RecA/RadA family phage recombinase